MRSIVSSVSGVSTGGAYDDLNIDKRTVEEDVVWTHLAARDVTTAPTSIGLYLRQGSSMYLLKEANPVTANLAVDVSPGVHVPGDWQPVARFTGATLADVLELYAYGYVED